MNVQSSFSFHIQWECDCLPGFMTSEQVNRGMLERETLQETYFQGNNSEVG